MFKFLLLIVVVLVGLLAFFWFGAQATPSWVQEGGYSQDANLNKLSRQIQQRGVANFLGDKFADVLRGELVLNEDEFNALLQASLSNDQDGRRLLRVSDVVRARLLPNMVEFGAVLNLNKIRQEDPKARKAIEEALAILPFDVGETVFVAISGEPVARSGNLGVKLDVSLQIGSLPISSAMLNTLGVDTGRLANESIPINLFSLQSVKAEQGKIRFGVLPKF